MKRIACGGWLCLAGLLVGPWLVGCEEEDIRVYEVPKENRTGAPVVREEGGMTANEQADREVPADGQPALPEGHPPIDGLAGADDGGNGGGTGEADQGAPMMPGGGGSMVDDGSLPAAKEQLDSPLTYRVPEGWRAGPETRMRVATLYFGEGEQQWELSVVPLGGRAGGMLANVNRWAGQVGAEPWSTAEMDERAVSVEVGGERGMMVDIRGPEEAIIGAIVPHQGMNWFFKAWGPVERADAVKPGFERFVASVRWGGDAADGTGDGNDEASGEPTGDPADTEVPSDPTGSSQP